MRTRLTTSPWAGHPPETSAALLEVLTTASTGATRITRADRLLFTACEFWASARNRALLDYMAVDGLWRLRGAEISFTALGLPLTAAIVRRARMTLAVDNPAPLSSMITALERSLELLDEPVDQVIADFARGRHTKSSAKTADH